jgi:glyoxylase-like metal-dependent hydrolase (beta-lactamase superfamily II)
VTFRATPGVMFSGDLLFAGSIGRTDLPGGDYPTILDSLARVCLTLPDEVQVLPGHGPGTTIGAERAGNPFLAGLTPRPPVPPGAASPETSAPGTVQPAAVPAAPPGRPGRGRPGL